MGLVYRIDLKGRDTFSRVGETSAAGGTLGNAGIAHFLSLFFGPSQLISKRTRRRTKINVHTSISLSFLLSLSLLCILNFHSPALSQGIIYRRNIKRQQHNSHEADEIVMTSSVPAENLGRSLMNSILLMLEIQVSFKDELSYR